jgi:hypothetical protein
MALKIITWVDLQGRYRVTSPNYHDTETEQETIDRTWAKVVASGGYGIPIDHPHFIVDTADQRPRLGELCLTYFRYGVNMRPDPDGLLKEDGTPKLGRDARDGAWEMDVDGLPKINFAKARGVQMDYIRLERDKELVKLDTRFIRAVESNDIPEQVLIARQKQGLRDIPQIFDLAPFATPIELADAWPAELTQPSRRQMGNRPVLTHGPVESPPRE